MQIDLNCDLGESFGRYTLGDDEALLALITSANIACGFHAGDPQVMDRTVRAALRRGVAIGAHPSYPDLQGFGRRRMDLSPEEVEACVLYQLGALRAFAQAAGADITHVKPHGALYNQAAEDPVIARAIARAVARFSRALRLVGLAGSALVAAALEAGLPSAAEGFPERGYGPDGRLISRRLPGASIDSPEQAADQALRLAREGAAGVPVQTLCIHSDNSNAVLIAQAVHARLEENGIEVRAMSHR
jgi:UPF0271 protein